MFVVVIRLLVSYVDCPCYMLIKIHVWVDTYAPINQTMLILLVVHYYPVESTQFVKKKIKNISVLFEYRECNHESKTDSGMTFFVF